MPNVFMLNDQPVNHIDIYFRYKLLRELREFFYTYNQLPNTKSYLIYIDE
jgi:hypothetical protein